MLPVVFGAVAAVGLAALLRSGRVSSGLDLFGHHLGGAFGFTSLGMDGDWDVYRYDGPRGSFTVAMFPSSAGDFPSPDESNVDYVYADGSKARVVRAQGPEGKKWASVDVLGGRRYDLYVYHPANHPGGFPDIYFQGPAFAPKVQCPTCMQPPVAPGTNISHRICRSCEGEGRYGAVSWWMGGRGTGAGGGVVSALGGRQVAVPYSFSSATESGYENFRSAPGPDPQAQWSEALKTWVDEDSGTAWSEEKMGWVEPTVDEFGFSILGIPIGKADRLERLEEKVQGGTEKLEELEKAAREEGADLDKISRQIAAIQSQIEKWENKRDKIEMRMGASYGGYGDDGDDDLYGLDEEDLEDQDEEMSPEDLEEEDLFGEDDDDVFGDLFDEDDEDELLE